jgi:RimJ/RimL family protein N-acetyltransferase
MMLPGAPRLPTLETARLRLRHVGAGDAADLFTVFGDVEVMRYWSRPAFEDLSETDDYIAAIHEGFSRRSLFQWALERKADHVVIGTCTLAQLDASNRRAEVGFALGRSSWGAGLGQEAVSRLLEFAFGELGLHRIEADVDPRNTRSLSVLQRLGFVREGQLRERWLVGGQAQDSVLLGLLAREWPPGDTSPGRG